MNDFTKRILTTEKNIYFPNRREFFTALILRQDRYYLWQYQKTLRLLEADTKNNPSFIYKTIRKNIIGRKLGIELPENVFGEGLVIFHSRGIVVNNKSRVGKNCHLHGNNCIGNDGFNEGAPIIGDNCILGVGAKVIGNIKLGNNVVVAAGAVVISTFKEDNILLAGVPAKIVKRY